MAENLKVTHYRNGDIIPNVPLSDWRSLTSGAYCVYNNDNNNLDTYGLLFNWFAISDSRKIAPDGWHIPTDEEWKELEMSLGMSQSQVDSLGYRGTNEGGKLKEVGTTRWTNPNIGATNSSAFSALPGGFMEAASSSFGKLGLSGLWWTATYYNSTSSYMRQLQNGTSQVIRGGSQGKHDGLSIRCVRN